MNEEAAPTEHETARAAKRVYLKAVHKLRDAIAAGELTPQEGRVMRESWKAGKDILKAYRHDLPLQTLR